MGFQFRFQELEIWQRAADLAIELADVADALDEIRKYRFAEQLRAAGLSISNNIAEGSGSETTPDFKRFLSFARKSVFECASMLLVFERKHFISPEQSHHLVDQLHQLSRMITAFSRSLKT